MKPWLTRIPEFSVPGFNDVIKSSNDGIKKNCKMETCATVLDEK